MRVTPPRDLIDVHIISAFAATFKNDDRLSIGEILDGANS
jgi:hypothetical protein